MGLTWAVGWAPIGALVGSTIGALLGLPVLGFAVNYAELFGVMGFIGGTMFSTVVRIADGGRRFDELSLPRFGLWGATGGMVLGALAVGINIVGLGGITPLTLAVVGAAGLLGAASAAGTLVLARHADDQELLAAGQETEAVGLSEAERQNLLAGKD